MAGSRSVDVTLNARYDDITAKYKSYIPLSAAQVAAGRTATVGLVSIAAKRTAAVKKLLSARGTAPRISKELAMQKNHVASASWEK